MYIPAWHFSWIPLFFLSFQSVVQAQLVNGQYFTKGLAISNAPAPNSEFTVGGNIGVSVEISGDGHLSTEASEPDNDLPTAFISLNIFLVSSETNKNVSVTVGPDFLAGEVGSTVKHLTYTIPSCLPKGNYNYTYYEVSRIDKEEYFSITPIPIRVLNPNSDSSGSCEGEFPVEEQPQASSPPPTNPFLQYATGTGGSPVATTSGVSGDNGQLQNVNGGSYGVIATAGWISGMFLAALVVL